MKLKMINIVFLCLLIISNMSCVFAEDKLEKVLTTEEINKIVRNENNEYGIPNKYWNEETGEFIIPDGYNKISKINIYGNDNERCVIGNKIKNLKIPNTVIEIESEAIFRMPLINIEIPDSVKIIGTGNFSETKIKEIKWPKSVTKIDDEMFGYGNIEKIEIPDTITDIGNISFLGTKLTEIYIPDSVVTMGKGVFYDSNFLQKVRLSNKLVKISSSSFWRNSFEEIEIPESVNEIEDDAFAGCKIKELKLPKGLTKIGDSVFWYCKQLEKLEMPGVKELGKYVFSNCDNLRELVVSKEFFKSENISKEAFEASPDEFYSDKGEKVKDGSIEVYVEDGIEGLNIEEIKRENKWLKSIDSLIKEKEEKEEKSIKIPETGMEKDKIMMISVIMSLSIVLTRLLKRKEVKI